LGRLLIDAGRAPSTYPWIVPHERQGQNIADFPHIKR
jgi:hypothetical protein